MSIYGLLIGIAVIFSIDQIFKIEKKIKYIDIFLILTSTLLFSRGLFLLHSIDEISTGAVNPIDISTGGLTLYGALLGLLISLFIVSKIRRIPFLRLTDYFFLFVPLVQSIGRWGNFFNNELYGKPTTLPWGIDIPLRNRLPGYEQYNKFHPMFLYESILDLCNFFFLRYVYRKSSSQGFVTALYLIIYGIIRLLMNTLRIDKEYIFSIETSDLFSTLSILIGLSILIRIYTKRKTY